MSSCPHGPAVGSAPLGSLVAPVTGSPVAEEGQATLFIVRHGVAVARDRWSGADSYRPLTKKGRAQAAVLADWIGEPITSIATSPTLRCMATVLALSLRQQVELSTRAALAVGRPEEAAHFARSLLKHAGGVICSHGEVIPALLSALGVCSTQPLDRCAKGSVWSIRRCGSALHGDYHELTPAAGPLTLTADLPGDPSG